MQGDLYINGIDAYDEWGMGLEDGGVSVLLTPPGNKSYLKNTSRLEHGSRMMTNNAKMEERELTLSIHFSAKSRNEFFVKYASFADVLKTGVLDIELPRIQPGVTYHCVYISCSQFRQLIQGIALYTLRLIEPDPSNR